jgi:hypothetical protein
LDRQAQDNYYSIICVVYSPGQFLYTFFIWHFPKDIKMTSEGVQEPRDIKWK